MLVLAFQTGDDDYCPPPPQPASAKVATGEKRELKFWVASVTDICQHCLSIYCDTHSQ